jgi:hypothetical protein
MSVVQVFWATAVVLERHMTLETQVATLVSATTALQNTVAAELAKVRSENSTFKDTVVEKATSSTDNALVLFNGTSGKLIKNTARARVLTNENGAGIGCLFDDIYIGLGTNVIPGGGGRNVTNCIVGGNANLSKNTGVYNTGFGYATLLENTTGYSNVAVGVNSLGKNTIGMANVGIGVEALAQNVSGSFNTAIGYLALDTSSASNVTNCTGIGRDSQVTGNNQVQLGNSLTTTFVFGTVQNRSDARDKADIRPTRLGLDFIKLLNPVDYRWDMRDYYRIPMPAPLGENASEEQKAIYETELKKYREGNKLSNITHDGSKKKKRFHHGVIAQEVADLIKNGSIDDFGGYQDHKISGGEDVLSIGYDELIAPLIKAVQELAQANEELRGRIATLEAK